MKSANVKVLNEASIGLDDEWKLCFQYCSYEFGDANHTVQNGYRFIWRKPDGSLQAARGQARIPSIAHIQYLTYKALSEGWGHNQHGEIELGE